MPKSLSVKNIPNLCRKLAHRYMQAFYTDWVYKVFWHFLKMYPICVECLHIGICKHSTQIGYIRLTPIPFLHKLGTFSKMCPICVECLRIFLIFSNSILWKSRHFSISFGKKTYFLLALTYIDAFSQSLGSCESNQVQFLFAVHF